MGDISKNSKAYKKVEINEVQDFPSNLKLEIEGFEWDFNEFARINDTHEIAYWFSVYFWQQRTLLSSKTRKVHMYSYRLFWEFISVYYPKLTNLSELNSELLFKFLSWLKQRNTTKYKNDTSKNDIFSQGTLRHVYGVIKKTIENVFRYQRVGFDIKLPNGNLTNSNLNTVSTIGFSETERLRIIAACKKEFDLIQSGEVTNLRHIYVPFILTIALRTGLNVQPLLGLRVDSYRDCILEGRVEIGVHKNRGWSSQRISLKGDDVKETAYASKNIAFLIEDLIQRSSKLRINAPEKVSPFIFLVEKQNGSIDIFKDEELWVNIQRFRDKYDLVDDSGNDLELNVRRFRPTFAYLLLKKNGGDLRHVQKALNHSSILTTIGYLNTNQEEFRSSFKFNGLVMQHSLTGGDPKKLANEINCSIEEAENLIAGNNGMKVSTCKNPFRLPFRNETLSEPCTQFTACFRCQNQIITADDSHKIFSFYWWLIDRKNKMPLTAWNKAYEWIVRTIENEVTEKLSALLDVKQAKENARIKPHPAWII